MSQEERFRLRVEGVFDITGRGTAVLGPIIDGVLTIGDVLVVEGREDGPNAQCVAIDAAPRAPQTLVDGLPRIGLKVPAWSKEDVSEGDFLVTVNPV